MKVYRFTRVEGASIQMGNIKLKVIPFDTEKHFCIFLEGEGFPSVVADGYYISFKVASINPAYTEVCRVTLQNPCERTGPDHSCKNNG